ncbi:MAG TPA: hypothetical protein VGE90_06740 [Chitinophaga sp.]
MNIDTDRFKAFINNSFPAYKIEIKEFKSGVIVIDIFRARDFIAIQYDGESYIGVSVIPSNGKTASYGLLDKVFDKIEDFEGYITEMIK